MELKLANKLKDIVKRHQVSVTQHSCTQCWSALGKAPGLPLGGSEDTGQQQQLTCGMVFILPWRLNPGCAPKANLDLLPGGSG